MERYSNGYHFGKMWAHFFLFNFLEEGANNTVESRLG